MPVIFVHGVNNRKEDQDYEPRRLVAENFLKKYLQGISINNKTLVNTTGFFPYWGDLATKFAWDMKSLPSGHIDALGVAGVENHLRPLVAIIRDALDNPDEAEDQPLLVLSRKSFPTAVNVVADLVLQNAPPEQSDAAARFVVEAQLYALKHFPPAPAPPWLAPLTTDEQFIASLVNAVKASSMDPQVNALGIFDPIVNTLSAGAAKLKQATKAAATKVLDTVGDFASTKVLAWTRGSLNATLGRFFGDVFVYMNARGTQAKPGAIPTRILGEWDKAIAASSGEPLIIIGHSLGGVITFDLLSSFRTNLVVDLFVSVGSQVSHFEEMKLFVASDTTIPKPGAPKAAKPPNIKHWINVLDEVDIFSYACASVFDGVQDLHYDTQTYVIKAHGAYFDQPRFYERLRARITQLPIV